MSRHGQALLLAGALMLGLGAVPAAAGTDDITVVSGGKAEALSLQEIEAFPAVQVTVRFGTDHGPFQGSFSGPLLWTVLQRLGAIDAKKPRQAVSQTILVTGHDGYVAALAMGEIAPAFEGKTVILGESMNGRPLGPLHLRLVVPGDRKGGRSVRDVMRIVVSPPVEH